MGLNIENVRNKVNDGLDSIKKNDTVKKATDSVKNVDVDKVRDKASDVLDSAKKTLTRVVKEIDNQVDKLHK